MTVGRSWPVMGRSGLSSSRNVGDDSQVMVVMDSYESDRGPG